MKHWHRFGQSRFPTRRRVVQRWRSECEHQDRRLRDTIVLSDVDFDIVRSFPEYIEGGLVVLVDQPRSVGVWRMLMLRMYGRRMSNISVLAGTDEVMFGIWQRSNQ